MKTFIGLLLISPLVILLGGIFVAAFLAFGLSYLLVTGGLIIVAISFTIGLALIFED
jgi:hypothetical protein